MSIRKGDTVIAGAYNLEKVQDGVARKNVGDVFWTMRKDTSNDGINGAYDCNGREFLSTDFQGDQSPYTLLVEGLLPSVTYQQYEQELTNNNGNCGYFGLDTTAQKFKVPTYSEICILSGNLQDIGKYIPDGVPETALGSITVKGNVQSNGIAQLDINESGYYEQWYSNDMGLLSQEPTTEANVTLGNEVDQVKPKTITLRAMIQLATRGQDISIKQYTDQLDGLVEDAQESANLAQQAAVNAAITLKGEYSTETTYGMNNAVTVTTEEGTQYYVSLVADNLNNPVTDTTKWAPWIFIPLVQDGSNGLGVDIGTIITSLSSVAPEGFNSCDGTVIAESDNPELWEAAAYTEKEGDGVPLKELPMVGDWNTLPWVEPKDTSVGGDMFLNTKPLKSIRVPFNSQAIELDIGQEFALMGDDCCIVWACSNDTGIGNGEGDPENTVIKVTKAKSSGYLGVAPSNTWSGYYPAQTHNNNWMIVDDADQGTYDMYTGNRSKYDNGYKYNDILFIAQWDGVAGHPIKVLFANPYIQWADMGENKLPVINNSTVTSGGCKDYYRLIGSKIAEYSSSVVDNVVRTDVTFNDLRVLGMYGANSSGYLNKNIILNGLEVDNLWTASAGTGDTRVIIVDDNGDFGYNPRHNASMTTSEILFTGDRGLSSPDNSYYTGGGTRIWFYNEDINMLYACERASTSSAWGPWHACPGYAIAANLTSNTSNVVSVSKFATSNISPLSEFSIEMAKNNGNCGYFGLDYVNKFVKLPVLNKIFLEGYNTVGSSTPIGGYIQDQIVNIKGMVQAGSGAGGATGGGSGMFRAGATGAFYVDDQMQYLANAYLADSQPSGAFYRNLLFNASRQVNTGDRVKPRSIAVYYYVCTSPFEVVASGATFTPQTQSTEEGVELSWTNDKGLANPASVVIPKGEKGDTGNTGPSNVLTIGTVQSGETAGATITGTSPSQTLNLTLPQGEKGDKGEKGNNGVGFDIGTVFSSLNSTPPDGCNATDGTEVTKQNYPDLYNACTTTTESITRYELVDATQFITKLDDATLQVASVKFSDGTVIPSKQITDYNGAPVVIVNAVDNEWQLVCTQGYTGVGILVSDTIPTEPVNTNYGYWTYCKLDGYVYAYNNSTNWSLSGGTTFEKQIYCPGVFDVPNNQPMQANGVTYTINTTVQADPKLPVCTYEEYETYLTNNNGNCGFFGVDTANEKIKLPTLDKVFLEVGNTDIGSYSQDQIVNLTSDTFVFGNGASGSTGGGRSVITTTGGHDNTNDSLYAYDPLQYIGIDISSTLGSSSGRVPQRFLKLDASRQVNTGDRVKPRSIAMYFYVCLEKFTAMERGVTFTPSVSEDGVISWTNDGGLVNPEPVSIKGTPGEISTLSIGTVEQGDTTSVTISGQAPNQVLNFVLQKGNDGQQGEQGEQGPAGPSNTLTIGEVTSGSTASAEITGTSPNQVLNLVLPKGDKGDIGDTGPQGEIGATGPANTLTIGTVEGGDTAQASITGQSPNQVLNLTLPKGEKGDTGDQGPQGEAAFTVSIGQVTTLQPTEQATVVNSGTAQSQIWDISIPKGDKGDSGVTIVTTISASSTDEEVPSAKCMWDLIGDIETLLSEV